MSKPSFYFTILKKLQLIAHSTEGGLTETGDVHTGSGTSGGLSIDDSNLSTMGASAVFVSRGGSFIDDTSSSETDSWVYNAMKAKADGLSTIPAGRAGAGGDAMPTVIQGPWTTLQVTPPDHKLLDVFKDWINQGHPNDAEVHTQKPGTAIAADPSSVKLFIRNDVADDGTNPLPADYWARAQIFLVDPASGAVVNPPNLASGQEYWLIAVVGNRGSAKGGRWQLSGGSPQATGAPVLSQGWVAVWNTGLSPGVTLPALSNLHYVPDVTDLASLNDEFETYSIPSHGWDLVGFRLNAQDVFDGLVQELVASGIDLGAPPSTPREDAAVAWLKDPVHGAHLCTQVRIKGDTAGQSYPPFSLPLTLVPSADIHRIGQKNLIPFNISLNSVNDNPPVNFWSFIAGLKMIALFEHDPEIGVNWLRIRPEIEAEGFRFFLALPERTFIRLIREPEALEGFRVVKGFTSDRLASDVGDFHRDILKRKHEFAMAEASSLRGATMVHAKSGQRVRVPFTHFVMLEADAKGNALRLPQLDGEFAAAALGVWYDPARLKPGRLGDITVVQEGNVPVFDPGERCYKVERRILGGFTIQVTVVEDRHLDPRWAIVKDEWQFLPPEKHLQDLGYEES